MFLVSLILLVQKFTSPLHMCISGHASCRHVCRPPLPTQTSASAAAGQKAVHPALSLQLGPRGLGFALADSGFALSDSAAPLWLGCTCTGGSCRSALGVHHCVLGCQADSLRLAGGALGSGCVCRGRGIAATGQCQASPLQMQTQVVVAATQYAMHQVLAVAAGAAGIGGGCKGQWQEYAQVQLTFAAAHRHH